jgi:hypothetical protein
MELTECIGDNGLFLKKRYFLKKYNKFPNKFTLVINENENYCDVLKITNELIYNIFGKNAEIIRDISEYTSKNNSDIDELLLDTSENSNITVFLDRTVVIIDINSIELYYIDSEISNPEEWCKKVWSLLPRKEKEPKEAVVNLVGYSDGQYYTISSKIKKVDIDINENYNDNFIPVFKDIKVFLNSRESGLILLFGAPGTGKSSFIRYLCNKEPNDYIIVPTSLTSRLGDPDFVSFMIDNANSIFILEDCEQVLMDRGINMFNGAISNILNMSDGLLSDIMNLKFICTFNADVNKIDSALLRKGRCYAKYEFEALSKDKVEFLNNKYKLGLSEIKPMTLAELYNSDQTSYEDNKVKKKIGF